MQLYYKMFSSTRHGFLGAGVLLQPLSHVWAAVSDPTLWPLYHKPIQTVRLHQRVTNSISLGTRGGLCRLRWQVGAASSGGWVLRLPRDCSGSVQLGGRLWDGRVLGRPWARTVWTRCVRASADSLPLTLQCTWCAVPPCAP